MSEAQMQMRLTRVFSSTTKRPHPFARIFSAVVPADSLKNKHPWEESNPYLLARIESVYPLTYRGKEKEAYKYAGEFFIFYASLISLCIYDSRFDGKMKMPNCAL